jgi:hypothetical protein
MKDHFKAATEIISTWPRWKKELAGEAVDVLSDTKREDVVAYLRNEASRDVPDHIDAPTVIWAMKYVADYLDRY